MRTQSLQSLLVRRAILSPEQVDDAVVDARGSGGTWLEQLVMDGVIDEERLATWFSDELKVPTVTLPNLANLAPGLVDLIPREVAVEHRVVPLEVDEDGYLHVAMVDPSDEAALGEVEFFAGRPLMRQVASATAIAWALHRYHGARTALWPRRSAILRAVGA